VIWFSISALEKAPVRKTGSFPPEFIDLAEEDAFAPDGSGSYDLTAMLVSGGVLVSGSASTPLKSICGRCLKEISFTLDSGKLQLFFEIEEEQEILEIDEDLRSELLLALPMNPLCSNDCQGLCPVCGTDLNKSQCKCIKEDTASAVSPWSTLDDLDL
jgi:uncharacterized protein